MSNTVRLYHFVSDRHGLENIEKRRLKKSFSDRVNDLFELRPFDFGEGVAGRRLRFVWDDEIRKHAMTQGFISFSKNWYAPTMWGHYADNHSGICLGFDILANLVDEIAYEGKLKKMDDRIFTDKQYNEDMVKYSKKTKSEHWHYEEESRFWSTLSPKETSQKSASPDQLFFQNFEEELMLREVIIGHRSKLSTKEIQGYLLPSDNVGITTARPSFRKFAMVPQNNKKYQK